MQKLPAYSGCLLHPILSSHSLIGQAPQNIRRIRARTSHAGQDQGCYESAQRLDPSSDVLRFTSCLEKREIGFYRQSAFRGPADWCFGLSGSSAPGSRPGRRDLRPAWRPITVDPLSKSQANARTGEAFTPGWAMLGGVSREGVSAVQSAEAHLGARLSLCLFAWFGGTVSAPLAA